MHIPNQDHYKIMTPIDKGWSRDQKVYLETHEGEKRLIRFSPFSQYDKTKKTYEAIKKMASLGFPMAQPLAFGTTNDKAFVYMLLSWVDGKDLEDVLPTLSEDTQYQLGLEAGDILRRIHSLPIPKRMLPKQSDHARKLRQINDYKASKHRINHDEDALRFIETHMERIWTRTPVFCHGDFHPGNLVYMADGHLGVIDFNRVRITDPYEAFYKLQSFGRSISIPFSIGEIHGYFENQVPSDFWDVVAVYVAHASLYSITWAEGFGEEDIRHMTKICQQAFDDYDDFKKVIPTWYKDPQGPTKED
jgi:aminoglycoside phosphotransferase (APT) family kinase protein